MASLSPTFKGSASFVLNNADIRTVARNIILTLIALVVEDDHEAAECMTHVWFSAALREQDSDILQRRVRPLIQAVVETIPEEPSHDLKLRKTWIFEFGVVHVELTEMQWIWLLLVIEGPRELSFEEGLANRRASTLDPAVIDKRLICQLSEHRRVAVMKYLEDGLLLPFGTSSEEFTALNPTFFNDTNWVFASMADPVNGWSPGEFETNPAVASTANDIYGKMYHGLLDLLRSFRSRLRSHNCEILHLNLPPMSLREALEDDAFARVDAGCLCDANGSSTRAVLRSLGPLLQRSQENPHATLVTLYTYAAEEAHTQWDSLADSQATRDETIKFNPYNMAAGPIDRDGARAWLARSFFRDDEKIWRRYTNAQGFVELQLNGVGSCKMAVQDINTIVEKWPMRRKLRHGQPGAQQEFELAFSSGHRGNERYVEWKRVQ